MIVYCVAAVCIKLDIALGQKKIEYHDENTNLQHNVTNLWILMYVYLYWLRYRCCCQVAFKSGYLCLVELFTLYKYWTVSLVSGILFLANISTSCDNALLGWHPHLIKKGRVEKRSVYIYIKWYIGMTKGLLVTVNLTRVLFLTLSVKGVENASWYIQPPSYNQIIQTVYLQYVIFKSLIVLICCRE